MHPVRKQRLIIVLCVVAFSSLAIGLAVYALRGNINLFYPPAEVAAGLAPEGTPIRVGGMVVEGSVQRSEDSLAVRFAVTDYQATVPVVYEGILPDLFDEGQGAVAAGVLGAQLEEVELQLGRERQRGRVDPELEVGARVEERG